MQRRGRWTRPTIVRVPSIRLLSIVPTLAIAAVLVFVYTRSVSTRRAFVFAYSDPTLLTAYTAHFVHFSAAHLYTNLFAFVLTSTILYLLFAHARSRLLYLGLLVSVIGVVPVALSYSNLAVPRNGILYGFSGITMALVGVLPVAVAQYVERRTQRPVETTFLLASFFVSVTYVAYASVPLSERSLRISLVAAALGLTFGGQWYVAEQPRLGSKRCWMKIARVAPLPTIGLGVWILLLRLGFPSVAITADAVINIYVHFLGYALGFLIAYSVHEWQRLNTRSRTRSYTPPAPD